MIILLSVICFFVCVFIIVAHDGVEDGDDFLNILFKSLAGSVLFSAGLLLIVAVSHGNASNRGNIDYEQKIAKAERINSALVKSINSEIAKNYGEKSVKISQKNAGNISVLYPKVSEENPFFDLAVSQYKANLTKIKELKKSEKNQNESNKSWIKIRWWIYFG